ncbi:MAG: SOS response-associated peptidase [Actinobacteria bacterium]|nr:SOS response-associated peptidase [Actinomycetota bacterium]
MCGRFVSTASPAVLAGYLRVDEVRTEALAPSWNVAPTDPVYAVSETADGCRLLGTYRWGLVPSWAPSASIASRRINARAETLESKFRGPFERRRCLLPADGFYEWQRRPDGAKQAWLVRRRDGAPMVFAGLWELWRPGHGQDVLRTCTIVTTAANPLLGPVHDRMPVVLAPGDWDEWLDRHQTDTGSLRRLLQPADGGHLEMFEVSSRVNSVRNDGDDLVAPLNPR